MGDITENRLCPACQKGYLEDRKKDLVFSYRAKTITFPQESIRVCMLCGFEALASREDNNRIEADLKDFRQMMERRDDEDRPETIG